MKKKLVAIATVLCLVLSMTTLVFAGNGNGGGGGNGGGSGDGSGGGDNPLTVTEVQYDGADLSGQTAAETGTIYIIFDRGMTENADANAALIKIYDESGAEVTATVAMGENKSEMTVDFEDLESGTYSLVIGSDVMANNGNTLGEDYVVTFTVESSVVETTETTTEETTVAATTAEEIVTEAETVAPTDEITAAAPESTGLPAYVIVIIVVVAVAIIVVIIVLVMKKKKKNEQ